MYIEEENIEINQEPATEIEPEDKGNDIMENPFNPSLINIETQTPALYNIISRLKANPPEINLYPDFQRKDNLWDAGKQSRLIESILISFPLPAFYFDGTNDYSWLIVDGLQRLSAIRNFVIDQSLVLDKMEYLKNLEGLTFNSLPRSLQRKIEETQIIAYVIKAGTPHEVKFNIFRRINTGGLVLEPQEIRHALNQGLPAQTVAEMADYREFKEATENKIKTDRMLDREFITRFIAFYLNDTETYKPDLDSFLNSSMSQINKLSDKELEIMKRDFRESMKYSKKIFGNWAFRKADMYPHKRKPINKALFEVWSVNLAKISTEEKEVLFKNREKLMSEFAEMMRSDEKFISSVTSGTGSRQQVIERFSKIENLISRFL